MPCMEVRQSYQYTPAHRASLTGDLPPVRPGDGRLRDRGQLARARHMETGRDQWPDRHTGTSHVFAINRYLQYLVAKGRKKAWESFRAPPLGHT